VTEPKLLTDVAAWWGAVLATIVFAWELYKWWHRVRVQVSAQSNMVEHVVGSGVRPAHPTRYRVVVVAVNVGDQPVTLLHIAVEQYRSWWGAAAAQADGDLLRGATDRRVPAAPSPSRRAMAGGG
jgi:hypothetical protein